MAQSRVEISGQVISNTNEIDRITVYNTNSKQGTITNTEGHFLIEAKQGDTLQISAVQFKKVEIVVSEDIIASKTLKVYLDEYVNQLDEVVVGKVLTGDLLSDINNSDAERPLNFYDVGIPGYTGKKMTQPERRLYEANGQKIKWYTVFTGSIPLNPILNGISGRTKELKLQVELERNDALLHRIKTTLEDDFFSVYELNESKRHDFFYFCSESPDFEARCRGKTNVEILKFLTEKLKAYKKNLDESED